MYIYPNTEFAEEVDRQLGRVDVEALSPPLDSWSRTIRHSIGLPVSALAKRLGISQPSATSLEHNEEDRTITLSRLDAVADALNCDLVYAFIPREPLTKTAMAFEAEQDKARKAHRKLPRPQ
jgi:predicted DNA-binding mobile mystery protein A